jgi:hypothetical protein
VEGRRVKMYWGPLLEEKWLGRGVDHPPPYSSEVKERVEVCLYFRFVFSWNVKK